MKLSDSKSIKYLYNISTLICYYSSYRKYNACTYRCVHGSIDIKHKPKFIYHLFIYLRSNFFLKMKGKKKFVLFVKHQKMLMSKEGLNKPLMKFIEAHFSHKS